MSDDGIRAAIGIAAFWTIAGLRMAFVSPGNQHGNWGFRIANGRAQHPSAAIDMLLAAKVWALVCGGIVTFGTFLVLRAFATSELLTWPATASQLLIAAGMCLLFTDIFFINITTVAFTGDPQRKQSSLAFTLLKYFTFFAVVAFSLVSEPWIEGNVRHLIFAAAAAIASAHLALRTRYRRAIFEHTNLVQLEDNEEEFPMKLGLRY